MSSGKHRRGGCLVHVLAALAALAVLAILAGCTDPPQSGYITKMPYAGESYWYTSECSMSVPVYNPTTKTNSNHCIMWVQNRHVNPPKWEICLKADDDPKHKGCFEVPQDLYNKYQVGQHYPNAM